MFPHEMSRSRDFNFRTVCTILLGLALSALTAQAAETRPPGLLATFAAGGQSDLAVTPNVWLHVGAGEPATPFLPAGKFTTTWEGTISAELRGEFLFRAELSGSVKLEINGQSVLEATGTGAAPSAASAPVKLNKGPNTLKAIFTGPDKGDACIRLQWSERGILWEPVPAVALMHTDTAASARAAQLRLGREAFLEFRCAKCHGGVDEKTGVPELSMDAPDFEGIGSRRRRDWLARWIENPKSLRPQAHMPRIFHGPSATENARIIAAFLASLTTTDSAPAAPSAGRAEEGRALAAKLNCGGCHQLPGETKPDAKKIPLVGVGEKFSPGALSAFLLQPEQHYAWIRMPNFKLSPDEAVQLAAFLAPEGKSAASAEPTDADALARGRKLVQTSGCLNCHNLKIENQFSAKGLADLKWQEGCLGAADANSRAPSFDLSAPEKLALQAFGAGDRASLARHVPAEFAERQTSLLNCRACHGQIENFPPLEILGGKLRPEWAAKFIAGQIPYKPRPWLEFRMPAFARRAPLLARGMAQAHGYPPTSPTEPPVDPEMAKIGQKLVSPDGGFSCISCHSVNGMKATQVFESEGINMMYSAERILPSYFQRWVRNPPRIDPNSKMPVYFDEDGKSPLTEVLGGDASKQIDALWHYLRLGREIQPPNL